MQNTIGPFFLDLTEAEIAEAQASFGDVLRSGNLILGAQTEAFEAEFAAFVGTKHAVSCNSGSSAIEFMMRIKGVAGRTVLVPTNTNFADPAMVLHAGGRVRYLDMDPRTFAPSLAQVEAALARAGREDPAHPVAGILWVHIGGVISPVFPAVVELCRSRGIFLVEDAAHAHGSRLGGRDAGAMADGGVFSFFPTKVMTTGEGGMIVTDSDDEAFLARSLRNQGKRGAKFGGLHHDLGTSGRVTELGAVVGRIQLRKLADMLARRQRCYDIMAKRFDAAGLAYVSTAHMDRASQYKMIVPLPPGRDAAATKAALKEKGVIAGGGVYEIPCHLQPVFAGIDAGADLPMATEWCPRHLCPPLTSGMSDAAAAHVADAVVAALA